MLIQATITEKIQSSLEPAHLEVINESHNHSVPAGSESHFKVIVVADQFEGKPLLGRHRMINKLLAHELENGVHALAMKLMTPAQWHAAGEQHGHVSPKCASKL